MANAGTLDIFTLYATFYANEAKNALPAPSPGWLVPSFSLRPSPAPGRLAADRPLLFGEAGDAIKQSQPATLNRYVPSFGQFCGRNGRRRVCVGGSPTIEGWLAIDLASLRRLASLGLLTRCCRRGTDLGDALGQRASIAAGAGGPRRRRHPGP